MRDRPRLAKFLSYGDNGRAPASSFYPSLYSSNNSLCYGQMYVSTSHNNNISHPPPKPPTSPVSRRKSRSKVKAKRSKSKPPNIEQQQSVFDSLASQESCQTSPPRKRRSPSKSRVKRTQSRPPTELLSLPFNPTGETEVSPSNQRRSRSKTRDRVKRSQSIASNIENLPPPCSPGPGSQAAPVDPPTINSPANLSKGKNKNKTKVRRSQSEAPNRILSEKSLWEDLTLQAKENFHNYIYKSRPNASSPTTTTVYGDLSLSLSSRCQCDQYPASRRGRSKSRSRRSVKSPSGPYSLNYPSSPLPGVAVRGRSKSRSRQLTLNNGVDTIWPDSRGVWLPV